MSVAVPPRAKQEREAHFPGVEKPSYSALILQVPHVFKLHYVLVSTLAPNYRFYSVSLGPRPLREVYVNTTDRVCVCVRVRCQRTAVNLCMDPDLLRRIHKRNEVYKREVENSMATPAWTKEP